MKNLLALVLISFFALTAYSQNQTLVVPEVVKQKIAQEYPTVKDIEWEPQDGFYEASFLFNNVETSVVLDRNGRIGLVESEIKVSELPQNIREFSTAKLNSREVSSAYRIVNAVGAVSYKIEVAGYDYHFDEKGNFVRQEMDDDDDDEIGEDDK